LIAFAWVVVGEIILGEIGLIIFFRKTPFTFKIDKKLMLGLFITAFPLFMQNILVTVNQKIDQIAIGTFLTTKDLGIYSVAIRITEIFYLLPGALAVSILPYISNIADEKSWRLN
jgi:polysaccharide transporter, PST family